MSGRLEGKVAIVTGAADGMGAAIAMRFASEGASVLAADLAADKLEAAHKGADHIVSLAKDITDGDAADVLIGAAVDRFGGLDILVNNAGVVQYENTEDMSDANWKRTLDVNLNAMFYLSRRAIPEMKKRGGGRFINVASINAHVAAPGLAAYAASKHGVAGFTKTLAVELGEHDITANYICPGCILTGMTKPLMDQDPSLKDLFEGFSVVGRIGLPEDIASAALFLASDEASFITGHGLNVDGGYLAKV